MLSSIKQRSLFPSLCLFSSSLPRQQPLPSRSFLSSNSPTPPWSSPTRLVYSSSTPLRAAAEDASTSFSSPLVSSVAPAQPALVVQWNISQKHFKFLNALVCLTAISMAWLFFSAVPALLAFKRACESLEKLLDVTREELPDTMAAVRLSGMEISDLTMELSDLGEEITQGVRNSTRVVRVAHDKLRHLTSMTPSALFQGKASQKVEMRSSEVARKVRNLRERIVQGRGILQVIFSVAGFSKWAMKYLAFNKQKAGKS